MSQDQPQSHPWPKKFGAFVVGELAGYSAGLGAVVLLESKLPQASEQIRQGLKAVIGKGLPFCEAVDQLLGTELVAPNADNAEKIEKYADFTFPLATTFVGGNAANFATRAMMERALRLGGKASTVEKMFVGKLVDISVTLGAIGVTNRLVSTEAKERAIENVARVLSVFCRDCSPEGQESLHHLSELMVKALPGQLMGNTVNFVISSR